MQGRIAGPRQSHGLNPGFTGFWALVAVWTVPPPLRRPWCTCLLHVLCTVPLPQPRVVAYVLILIFQMGTARLREVQ